MLFSKLATHESLSLIIAGNYVLFLAEAGYASVCHLVSLVILSYSISEFLVYIFIVIRWLLSSLKHCRIVHNSCYTIIE